MWIYYLRNISIHCKLINQPFSLVSILLYHWNEHMQSLLPCVFRSMFGMCAWAVIDITYSAYQCIEGLFLLKSRGDSIECHYGEICVLRSPHQDQSREGLLEILNLWLADKMIVVQVKFTLGPRPMPFSMDLKVQLETYMAKVDGIILIYKGVFLLTISLRRIS